MTDKSQATDPLIGSAEWKASIRDDAGDYYGNDDEDEFDEGDEYQDECGLMGDGQCTMAGSEHCDFFCPNRDSEDFAGSSAWCRKHGVKAE